MVLLEFLYINYCIHIFELAETWILIMARDYTVYTQTEGVKPEWLQGTEWAPKLFKKISME